MSDTLPKEQVEDTVSETETEPDADRIKDPDTGMIMIKDIKKTVEAAFESILGVLLGIFFLVRRVETFELSRVL